VSRLILSKVTESHQFVRGVVLLRVEPRGFEPLTSAVQRRHDTFLEISSPCKIAADTHISYMMLFPNFQGIYSGCCTGLRRVSCGKCALTKIEIRSAAPSIRGLRSLPTGPQAGHTRVLELHTFRREEWAQVRAVVPTIHSGSQSVSDASFLSWRVVATETNGSAGPSTSWRRTRSPTGAP
jgi:hypothetical protein